MAESIAQNYFEKFTGPDAATVLSGLPGTHPKTFEDNWLDFKSGFTKPEDLEGIWSKVLGAMANAGGGVVVWGIGARKEGKPPVDAAHSLELVPDVNYLASRLTEIGHFATDPSLMEVQIKPIVVKAKVKEGFVVCLIPEGKTKPYQSVKAKRPFYLRMGDESKEPPLSILRQLFNPHLATKAKLTLTHSSRTVGANRVCMFSCSLLNTGLTTITSCTIGIDGDGLKLSETDGSLLHDFRQVELLFIPVPLLLHPSMKFDFRFFTPWERFSEQPITINLFQQNQEMKSERFLFDYVHVRFIRNGMYHMREQILDF